jgi:AP-2 complex subunit alpha
MYIYKYIYICIYIYIHLYIHIYRLAKSDGPKRAQAHQDIVLESLRDGDVSVRRRALDLIFVLVDETNSEEVVGELVLSLASGLYKIHVKY